MKILVGIIIKVVLVLAITLSGTALPAVFGQDANSSAVSQSSSLETTALVLNEDLGAVVPLSNYADFVPIEDGSNCYVFLDLSAVGPCYFYPRYGSIEAGSEAEKFLKNARFSSKLVSLGTATMMFDFCLLDIDYTMLGSVQCYAKRWPNWSVSSPIYGFRFDSIYFKISQNLYNMLEDVKNSPLKIALYLDGQSEKLYEDYNFFGNIVSGDKWNIKWSLTTETPEAFEKAREAEVPLEVNEYLTVLDILKDMFKEDGITFIEGLSMLLFPGENMLIDTYVSVITWIVVFTVVLLVFGLLRRFFSFVFGK